jgi:hypothetical protein
MEEVERISLLFAMNSMNDQRFFDLAMKVVARQATDQECADLDALLSCDPELQAEFAQLEADVRLMKGALPLVEAASGTPTEDGPFSVRLVKGALPLVEAARAEAGGLPAYARERLRTKVRQTLGRPQAEREPKRSLAWGWRWLLGLAATAAVVALVMVPLLRTSSAPVVELAMLDTGGAIRGSDTNEVVLLRDMWKTAKLVSFTSPNALRQWETDWASNQDAAKVIYDRAAAEVRIVGKWRGKTFERTFLVEPDLRATLSRVKSFLREQAAAK